jgi:hypothetical protein
MSMGMGIGWPTTDDGSSDRECPGDVAIAVATIAVSEHPGVDLKVPHRTCPVAMWPVESG